MNCLSVILISSVLRITLVRCQITCVLCQMQARRQGESEFGSKYSNLHSFNYHPILPKFIQHFYIEAFKNYCPIYIRKRRHFLVSIPTLSEFRMTHSKFHKVHAKTPRNCPAPNWKIDPTLTSTSSAGPRCGLVPANINSWGRYQIGLKICCFPWRNPCPSPSISPDKQSSFQFPDCPAQFSFPKNALPGKPFLIWFWISDSQCEQGKINLRPLVIRQTYTTHQTVPQKDALPG